MIGAGRIFCHADDENSAVGPVIAIDDRSRSNSNLRRDLAAAVIVAGGFIGAEDRRLPELRAAVGVESVDAVVLRRDEDDIL